MAPTVEVILEKASICLQQNGSDEMGLFARDHFEVIHGYSENGKGGGDGNVENHVLGTH